MADRLLRSPSPMAYPSSSRRSSPEPFAYDRYARSGSPDLVRSGRHSYSLGDISSVENERRGSRGSRDSLASCPSPGPWNYLDFSEQGESGSGLRTESPSSGGSKVPWRSVSQEDIFSRHKRLSKLQQELMSANKKIGRLDVLYEETNKRKGRLQEELLEACTKVAKLEATCASYQEKEAHLQDEVQSYRERNGKLELDVLSAFKKVSQLESELEAVEGRKNAVQRDRIAAQERISLLEAANERMKQRDSWTTAAAAKSADEFTSDRKLAELEATIRKLTRENEELRQEVRRTKSRTVLVEGELSKSNMEKASLSGKLCVARETSVHEPDQSVEILLEELNRFKELYQNALKTNPEAHDYKRLLVQVGNYKEECSRANERLRAMLEYESKYKEEKVRAEEARVELNGAERKLALAEQQLQKALKEKAVIAMEIGKSNDKGIKSQEAMIKMEKEATHFKKLREDSEKRAQESDAQLRTASKEREDLAQQCRELVRELEETDTELEQVLTTCEDLKAQLDSAGSAANNAGQQCAKLTRGNQALSDDLEESNAALGQVKSELARCKRQLNECKDSADAWEHKENEATKRAKQLSVEVEEVNELLDKKRSEVAELESKLKSCQHEKEGVTEEFYNLQDKMVALGSQLSRVEREKTGQESEREELETIMSRNQEETKKLRKALEEQKSESESAFRKSHDEELKAKQRSKELEAFEAKYNVAAAKLSDVERKYDAIVGERQELRREVLKAESDVAQLERSLNLVSKEKTELASEVERLSSHKSRRDSVVVKLENDLFQVKDSHEQLAERNKDDQVKLKKQTQELESALERSEAKSAQVAELVERCEALKLERQDLRENASLLKDQHARLQTQLDKEFREKENLRDELVEATRKVKRREEDIELLEGKLKEQADILERGSRRSREEQGQARSVKQELEMQTENYHEKCREFESAKAKLEGLQQDYDGKKKEILDAESTIGRLESRINKLEREKSELASEVDSRGSNMAKQSEGFAKQQKQLKDVKEILVNSQQQIDELQEQSKRQSEENRALFKQLTEKSADCVELETNVKDLQSSKSDLAREVKKLQGKCEDLEKQAEGEFREKLKLTEDLKSSEEMKQRACKDATSLKEQLKEYKNLYEANLKDSVIRRDSLDKKTHQHEELHKKYSKKAIELSEIEKRLEELRASNAKLKKDCYMKQTKVAKLEELLQKAIQETEQFGVMKKIFRDTQEELNERNEEIEECEVEIQTLKLRICELEASKTTLEKSNAVLKQSNESERVEDSLKKLSELENVYQHTSLAKETLEARLTEAKSLLAETEAQAKLLPQLHRELQQSQQELSDVEFDRSLVSKENMALKEKLVKLEDELSVVESEKASLAEELKKAQSPRKTGYSRGGLFIRNPEAEFNSFRPEVTGNLPGGFQTSTPLTSPRIVAALSSSFEVVKSKPKLTRKYSLDSAIMNNALNGRVSTSFENLTLDRYWVAPRTSNGHSRPGLASETTNMSFDSLVESEVSSDSNVSGTIEKHSPIDSGKSSRSVEDWETVSDVSSAAWTVNESVLTDVEGEPEADQSDTASVKQRFETSVKTPPKPAPKPARRSSNLSRSPSLTTLIEKHEESANSDGDTKPSKVRASASEGKTNLLDVSPRPSNTTIPTKSPVHIIDGDTKPSEVRASRSGAFTNPSNTPPKSPKVGLGAELDVKIIETITLSDTEAKPRQQMTSKLPTISDGKTNPLDVSPMPSNNSAPTKSPICIADGDTKPPEFRANRSDVSTNPSDTLPKSPKVDPISALDVKIIDTITPNTKAKPRQQMMSKLPTISDNKTNPHDVSPRPPNTSPRTKSPYLDPAAKLDVIISDTVPTPADSGGKHGLENVAQNTPVTKTKPIPSERKTPAGKRNSFVDSAIRYTEAGSKSSPDGSRLGQEGNKSSKLQVKEKNPKLQVEHPKLQVENPKLQVKKSGSVKPKAPSVNVKNMRNLWNEKSMEPRENTRKERQPIESGEKKTEMAVLGASKETVHENSGVSGKVNNGSSGEDGVAAPKQAKVSDLVNLFSG